MSGFLFQRASRFAKAVLQFHDLRVEVEKNFAYFNFFATFNFKL